MGIDSPGFFSNLGVPRMTIESQPLGSPENKRSGGIRLENLGWDFRFSFRSLRRSAGFSAAVIVTLALCIGANTTIMSVLYGLILKPMPFRDAGQLVQVYNSFPKNNRPKERISIPQYLDYKANADLCKDARDMAHLLRRERERLELVQRR